jgi:hypothetical protein
MSCVVRIKSCLTTRLSGDSPDLNQSLWRHQLAVKPDVALGDHVDQLGAAGREPYPRLGWPISDGSDMTVAVSAARCLPYFA